MKFLNRYSLHILSMYALIMLGVLVVFWDSFSMAQRFSIGLLGLLTLHEWEESRFPGGFFEMMGGMLNVDLSKVPEGSLHLPPSITIVVITLLPLLFPGVACLFLAAMYLGISRGLSTSLASSSLTRRSPTRPAWLPQR